MNREIQAEIDFFMQNIAEGHSNYIKLMINLCLLDDHISSYCLHNLGNYMFREDTPYDIASQIRCSFQKLFKKKNATIQEKIKRRPLIFFIAGALLDGDPLHGDFIPEYVREAIELYDCNEKNKPSWWAHQKMIHGYFVEPKYFLIPFV